MFLNTFDDRIQNNSLQLLLVITKWNSSLKIIVTLFFCFVVEIHQPLIWLVLIFFINKCYLNTWPTICILSKKKKNEEPSYQLSNGLLLLESKSFSINFLFVCFFNKNNFISMAAKEEN